MSPHFWKFILPINLLALSALTYMAVTGSYGFLWLTLIGYILIHGYGVSIGLHRFCSHSSFSTNIFVRRALIFLGALSGAGSPIWWAGAHQGLHHRFSDKPGDLHSPHDGKWHSYLGWQIDSSNTGTAIRYAPKWLRNDPFARFIHKHYTRIVWSTVVLCALLSWQVALFLIVLPQFLSGHVMNSANLLGHLPRFGYRNFDIDDDSTNVLLLGYVSFGEGFHNNHHRYPGSHTCKVRPFEIDISELLITYTLGARDIRA